MEIKPFKKKIWLSSPTMHGEELKYVKEAYKTNWVSTIGENIDECERLIAEITGAEYALCVNSGTSALHLAIKLAGVKKGDKVFCSDMTFVASANPIVYEGGEPIFIDSERDTWNMDPEALRRAFELYPEVKVVLLVDLYGTPSKIDEIREICTEHGATLIEDSAESLSSTYKGRHVGVTGDSGVISFNGNKIITGSAGGALLLHTKEDYLKAKKWSTQSRECAPWYQHEEIGYMYRMSNVIAGIIRGQIPYLEEHARRKKEIYSNYLDGLRDIPVSLNPYLADSEPNFWLTCLLVDRDKMCKQSRTDDRASFEKKKGRSCPTEIMDAISAINAESRPIWKPMHMQPIFKDCTFVTADSGECVSEDIFERGLCLPSDIKMTKKEQSVIINAIRNCFN